MSQIKPQYYGGRVWIADDPAMTLEERDSRDYDGAWGWWTALGTSLGLAGALFAAQARGSI